MDVNANELAGLFIPIIAIVMGIGMGIGLAMLAVWTEYQRKREMFELHHKERLLAIERGMEVPPLPTEFFGPADTQRNAARLRQGLVWSLVGVALFVALALNKGLEAAAWGLVPCALGFANLIYYFVLERQALAITQPPQR